MYTCFYLFTTGLDSFFSVRSIFKTLAREQNKLNLKLTTEFLPVDRYVTYDQFAKDAKAKVGMYAPKPNRCADNIIILQLELPNMYIYIYIISIYIYIVNPLVAFLQEWGRAGRDGEIATCVLLYSYSDKGRVESILRRGAAGARLDERLADLLALVAMCEDDGASTCSLCTRGPVSHTHSTYRHTG